MHDKSGLNVINDFPLAQFEASSQTDDDRSDDSGNVNDCLNEVSSQRELNETSALMTANNEIGTTSDSLSASANGKSDG
jgi:hypothetical protein